MLRFALPVVILAACSLLPAMALELSDLRLPLTRSEADKALSRDYNFRVLEDLTIRRSWVLKNRTVSVDFSPKDGDKALLIFIDYARPVSPAESADDATQLIGAPPAKWQALNASRASRLGMEAAEGFKLSAGRYCFRELDAQGNVVRLAYYADIPSREVRWLLADDVRDSGKTALGSRAAAGNTEYLWLDEERRRGVSANSSASSLASAAAAVVADGGAGTAAGKKEMVPRPEEEPADAMSQLKAYAASLTPTHYAIGGAVVVLWLLWLAISRAREAKRRAMVAYIMEQGKNKAGGKRGY